MQLVHRLRLPALFCALAVLACELISRPFTTTGICDDGPYILLVPKLLDTGHIVFNGAEAAMMGWQLYLGAALVKLFGFSFTTVRMSTLLVAMALAFVLQRTFVRAGINERNATIATLSLVLSPLYLLLSVTFMSDITGLFAIVLCLYGCLRALQASTTSAAILWLCFSVATNAICGTSRQIAWLGILVVVPSTLWLLRARRRLLLAGSAATLAGFLFVFLCMHWLKRQPYIITVPVLAKPTCSLPQFIEMVVNSLLELPFLLLPVVAMFLPRLRNRNILSRVLVSVACVAYGALTVHTGHLQYLEPTYPDWINRYGIVRVAGLKGEPSVFPGTLAQALLTLASYGGCLGLLSTFLRSHPTPPPFGSPTKPSWQQLAVLIAPFSIAYVVMLLPLCVTRGLSDRYFLSLLPAALLWLTLYYQHRIQAQLPLASAILVGLMAIYGIAVVHNTFAFYRARVALAAQLATVGVPETAVDNGWEYNFEIELQHADHINDYRLTVPVNAYVPSPPLPAGTCPMYFFDETPHVRPIYGVSFDPNACYGPAPFAPIHYSRWLSSKPGTLYVVRYTPPTKP